MTDPKQNAKEIVEGYVNIFRKTDTCFTYCANSLKCQHSWYNCESWFQTAKECAKIHVKRILEAAPLEPSEADWDDCGSNYAGWYYERRIEAETYWQSVLTEIENL